jgi:hypothetical protein
MPEYDYTEQDKSRMRYYYKELQEKFQKHPESLVLRNGIAHIEKVLNLPTTTTSVDPLKHLANNNAYTKN